MFLLGGNPGVADAAAARLQAMYPRLGEVGFYCPPFGFEDDPEELSRIRSTLRAARPDLVLVGLGFPKQERVIRAAAARAARCLVRGSRDLAQLHRRRSATSARDPPARRARVDTPPMARAAAAVPALRRARHPVQHQAVRLGAEAPPGREPQSLNTAGRRRPGRETADMLVSGARAGMSLGVARHLPAPLARGEDAPGLRAGGVRDSVGHRVQAGRRRGIRCRPRRHVRVRERSWLRRCSGFTTRFATGTRYGWLSVCSGSPSSSRTC